MFVIPAPYKGRDKLQQESRKTYTGCRIKCGMTCQPKVKKCWALCTSGAEVATIFEW